VKECESDGDVWECESNGDVWACRKGDRVELHAKWNVQNIR
jgi:hypothetical protein